MNSTKNTVYISNLNYKADRAVIRSMFARFGQIKDIKIIVEPKTNQSRGMAFVEMSSPVQAKEAIEGLHGKSFGGRMVKAKAATPQKNPEKKFFAPKSKKENKDLDFTAIQLAKKSRNEAKRKSNPIMMKYVPAKKKDA